MSPDPIALLREVTAIGPYFAVTVGEPGARPPAGFRPLREFYAPGPGGPLAQRIALAAGSLGGGEPRVTGSIVQLGLAARFWSIGLGTAALGSVLPELHPDRAHWRQPPEGLIEFWLPGPGTTRATPDLAGALHRAVLVDHLTPLSQAVRAVAPVAERLLWGNAASALAGAVRVLQVQRPDAAPRAAWLARELLARAPLAGTATVAPAGAAGLAFRRTTCCLYYRLPRAGLCGDCVFDTPPGAR